MGVEDLFEDYTLDNGVSVHRRFSYDYSGFLCVERSDMNGSSLGSDRYALSFSHFYSLKSIYLKRESDVLTFQTELKILTRLSDDERARRIHMILPHFGDAEKPLLR